MARFGLITQIEKAIRYRPSSVPTLFQ